MPGTKRLPLIALALLLTGFAAASVSTPRAEACYAYGVRNYYSSASYTNLVGQWTVSCNCTSSRWGSQTSYMVFEAFDCSGGPIDP